MCPAKVLPIISEAVWELNIKARVNSLNITIQLFAKRQNNRDMTFNVTHDHKTYKESPRHALLKSKQMIKQNRNI